MNTFWSIQAGLAAAALGGLVAASQGCGQSSNHGGAGGTDTDSSTDTPTDTGSTDTPCTSTAEDPCAFSGVCCDLEGCAQQKCQAECFSADGCATFSPGSDACVTCTLASCYAARESCGFCDSDPSVDPTAISETCGVFARADAPPGGDGTKAAPFDKLGDAIAKVEGKGLRVFACTSAPFQETLVLPSGADILGGVDCTKGWAYAASARTQILGSADAVPITAESFVKLSGLSIKAASPTDPAGGGSSIAVVTTLGQATLENCDLEASDAAAGADGAASSGTAAPGADAPAVDPTSANACVLPSAVSGGAAGATTCDDGPTTGGAGGKGGITGVSAGNGGDGADGTPAGDANHGAGANASQDCAAGTPGKLGAPGAPGPGGSAAGDKLAASGVLNADATDGSAGSKAQGGGGGGGALSGTFCGAGPTTVDGPGASGGGGGAGGCGGTGGRGGKAGGSSVAILNLGATVTLQSVTLKVGNAGKGGDGAAGQSGGSAGIGAIGGAASGLAPSKAGCSGGAGGIGGAGGPGGGGRGGHAIGVACATPPVTSPGGTFVAGAAGSGGKAGDATGNAGAAGNAGACWDFTANAACP
jgi:hypothetical protein